jgi:hypothetical protein
MSMPESDITTMNYPPQLVYQQPYPPPAPAKPKRWPWIIAVIGAFMIGAIAGYSGNPKAGSNSARETVTVRVPAPANAAPAATAPPTQAGPVATRR